MAISGGLQLLDIKEVLAKAQLIAGMQVADLGCGSLGYFVLPIAKLVGKEGKVYAVDVQLSALEGVRNRAKLDGLTNVETVWSNLEKVGATKIPEKSLDLACLINTLFQNKDHQSIIKEASRLLKSGGRLLVIDWKKVGTPFGPSVEIRLEPETVKKLAAKTGLTLTEEIEFGQYFWGLIFTKA
jgi:ubiquinone/menaquinone biosynthesis C-methylase UbiE